jgi:hypothetical protein
MEKNTWGRAREYVLFTRNYFIIKSRKVRWAKHVEGIE